MRRAFRYFLFAAFCLSAFYCQKEIHFDDTASTGGIVKGADGLCLPFHVSGEYVPGTDLTASNFVDLSVLVNQPGKYDIKTQRVNGYSFASSGTFNDSGVVNVRLFATGKPTAAGTDEFTVSFNGSSCNFNVVVSDSTVPGVYTLSGAPNECMVDTLNGIFVKDVTLDSSNNIVIGVEVSEPGAYNITTDDRNGYFFSGSGVFSTTGSQTVTLYAAGTPVEAKPDIFTVNTGTSSCTFSVNIIAPVEVTNDSYFPLTNGSYWSYEDLTPIKDSMRRTVIDTTSVNDIKYSIMEVKKKFGAVQHYLYRQFGSQYFEYANVDKYTGSLSYTPAVADEIYFLNQNIYKGTTWESAEYTGTISGGQTIILNYIFSCIENNITVTFNGKAFNNVNIVSITPQIKALSYGYSYTGEQYFYYYAKGIGLIYMIKLEHGARQSEWAIKDWDVK